MKGSRKSVLPDPAVSRRGTRPLAEPHFGKARPGTTRCSIENCIPATIVQQVCGSAYCVSHLYHVVAHLPACLGENHGIVLQWQSSSFDDPGTRPPITHFTNKRTPPLPDCSRRGIFVIPKWPRSLSTITGWPNKVFTQ